MSDPCALDVGKRRIHAPHQRSDAHGFVAGRTWCVAVVTARCVDRASARQQHETEHTENGESNSGQGPPPGVEGSFLVSAGQGGQHREGPMAGHRECA